MRFERRAAGRAKMDICEWVADLNRKAAAATARGIVGAEEVRRWPMISGVVKTKKGKKKKVLVPPQQPPSCGGEKKSKAFLPSEKLELRLRY